MSKIKGIDPTLELGPGGWPNVVETRPSAKSPVDPYVNNKNPAAAAAGELGVLAAAAAAGALPPPASPLNPAAPPPRPDRGC